MKHLLIIQEFLKEKRSLRNLPTTGLPFVTISRQAGAGGHLLAHVLTTDFLQFADDPLFVGWHVFDRELCEVIAQDPALQVSVEQLMAEHYKPDFADFVESLFTGRSDQYALHKKTFEVVRLLATLGQVILVGRAGACVTRDLPGGLHIRLVAPEAHRLRWMMDKFRIGKDEAAKRIQKQDADRRKLVRTYFDRDLEDPLLYDAVFNTERVNPHEISAAVVEMLRRRAKAPRKSAT
jgi:cytidylate kinase